LTSDDNEAMPADTKLTRHGFDNTLFCQGKYPININKKNGKFMWRIKVGRMF